MKSVLTAAVFLMFSQITFASEAQSELTVRFDDGSPETVGTLYFQGQSEKSDYTLIESPYIKLSMFSRAIPILKADDSGTALCQASFPSQPHSAVFKVGVANGNMGTLFEFLDYNRAATLKIEDGKLVALVKQDISQGSWHYILESSGCSSTPMESAGD